MNASLGNVVLLCTSLFGATALANEPNTLISVHITALSIDHRPVPGALKRSNIEYRLYNEETKETFRVEQFRKAKFIYLEPGVWCLHSTKHGKYNVVRVTNSGCFRVAEGVVNNAGTWIIGLSAHRGPSNSLLVEMRENHLELEEVLGVTGSKPTELSLPPQIIQERSADELSPLGT